MTRKLYGLSVLSGALLFLSFPKYGFCAVAWVALVPLLISLRELHVPEAFRAGFIAGMIYNVGIFYWISYVIAMYGNAPVYAGIALMLLLAMFLSLFVAVFSCLVVYFKDRGIEPFFAAPLLWVALEFAKSHLITGFPWENLAYSQYLLLPMIQISDITGFYGITFLIVLVNVVLSDILLKKGNKQIAVEITMGLVLLAMTFGYGHYRMKSINTISQGSDSEEIALIQGNIDQAVKWSPSFQNETLEIYRRQTLDAAALPRKPALIIWPETATPFYFQDTDVRYGEILNLAKTSRTHLLFGSPSYKVIKGYEESFNSAFLVAPEGKVTGRYDKMHLVPFGEYVPLRKLLPFMTNLVPGIGDFSTGDGFKPLAVNGRNIGVLICYEAIFPEITRAYVRAGIDLLVNLTNDAWFGRTSAPYQHLSMTAFRAIEARRYIVRAANTGISAIIGPTGQIESTTELFKQTSLSGKVRLMRVNTIYARMGDLFAHGCMALLGLLFIITIRRKNHVGRITGENFRSGKQGRETPELSLKSPAKKKR